MKPLSSFLKLLLTIALVFVINSCSNDDSSSPTTPEAQPELSLSTMSLDFGTSETYLTFTIKNVGGGELSWAIACEADWISISDDNGTTTTEEDRISVTLFRNKLSPGQRECAINVSPNIGDNKSISVKATIQPPELAVSDTTLDFGVNEDVLGFYIKNVGQGSFNWSVFPYPYSVNWISVYPDSGTTSDDSTYVVVTVDRSELFNDTYEARVIVDTEGDVNDQHIYVTMEVRKEKIWQYQFTDNSDLDYKWECRDLYDDLISGEDYWGVVSTETPTGSHAVWCAGRGSHSQGLYGNNMNAVMRLRPQEAVDIRNKENIVISFDMKYETEEGYDEIYFLVFSPSDDIWYYIGERTVWSGGDWEWDKYIISLDWWSEDHRPSTDLRIGYTFDSDISNARRGCLISNIEVWAK